MVTPARQPGAPPGALVATATRAVAVPLVSARSAVLPAIRQLGFTLAVDQLGLIVARRGSTFSGLSLSPSKVPLELRVDLEAEGDDRTTLTFRVEDRWSIAGTKQWGAVSAYRTAYGEITATLDRAVAGLSPEAVAEPWNMDLGTGDVAAFAGASTHAANAGKALSRGGDALFGSAKGPRAASDGLQTARLVCGDRHIDLPAERLDGLLTAGQLIAARPAPLPQHLAQQVQMLVLSLEMQLEALRTRAPGTPATLEITEEQLPVVTFCYQQSLLREQLPLRLLLQCTTCKLPKVVNPDFAALREKNRRRGVLAASVGGVFSTQGIAPYIMLGRLVQARNSDPDFVCARCQGLDADQTVITFCPSCGERRDEAVLRSCEHCGHDFRSRAAEVPAWRSEEVGDELSAAAAEPAALPPAPPAPPGAAAWLPDPTGEHDLRYWDGAEWTDHVANK